APAGGAAPALEVGQHGAPVPGAHRGDLGSDRLDLDGELVAEDARVGEERLAARERVVVGPADADAVDADERLARAGRGGLAGVERLESSGLGQTDRVHVSGSRGRGAGTARGARAPSNALSAPRAWRAARTV